MTLTATTLGTNAATTITNALTVSGKHLTSLGGNLYVDGTSTLKGDTTITDDLAVNGGDLTSSSATFNLLTNSTNPTRTVNFATQSDTINIGKAATVTKLAGTKESTSKDNASLVIEGGVGIEKKLFLGSDLTLMNGKLNSSIADSSTAIGLLVTTPSYTTSGAKLFSLKNGIDEKILCDKNGHTYIYGDLTVQGTNTVLSTSILQVTDKDIVLGSGIPNRASASGIRYPCRKSGITISKLYIRFN